MKRRTFRELCDLVTDFGADNPLYMPLALAGEVGEYLNIMKKLERDGLAATAYEITHGTRNLNAEHSHWDKEIVASKIGEELADVFIYLVLCARRWEPTINLELEIARKLEKVAEREKDRSIPGEPDNQ